MSSVTVDGATFFAEQRLRWREKEFQREVLTLAKDCGWTHRYHTYFSDRSERGFPDLVLVRPGTRNAGIAGFYSAGEIIFAELKTMKGKLSPAQHDWYDALRTLPNIRVKLWRPCCWNSGEIAEALQ